MRPLFFVNSGERVERAKRYGDRTSRHFRITGVDTNQFTFRSFAMEAYRRNRQAGSQFNDGQPAPGRGR